MIPLRLLELLGQLAAYEREAARETRELQAIVRDSRNDWRSFGAGSGSVGVPIAQATSISAGRDFSGIDRLYETPGERSARLAPKAK